MSRIYFTYFLSEIIQTFFLGIFVFVSLISMVQFLQISEFIFIHNVPIGQVAYILLHMSVSLMPTILPMSLLFSILLTYTRLTSDSEIIAFQSFGYSISSLIFPAFLFSLFVFIISYQTLDIIGPQSRKAFDDRIQKIGGQKVISNLSERTFVEDLFNFTLYFNEKIDEDHFKDIFIKDNRDPLHPHVIVAKYGEIETSNDNEQQRFSLRLRDGTATETSNVNSPSVKFDTYSLTLASPILKLIEDRDTNTFILRELSELIKSKKTSAASKYEYILEMHRRFSIALSCLIFGVLGATLGINTNRRSSTSKGFVLSVICLAAYWMLVAASTSLATSSNFRSPYYIWIPDVIFLALTCITYRRSTQTG